MIQVPVLKMSVWCLSVLVLLSGGSRVVGATTFEEVNAAFGVPFLVDDSLWDDPVADVAARLRWPQESQTSSESSFRKYAGPDDVILGARAHSLALYGGTHGCSSISMMFANKGDSARPAPGEQERPFRMAVRQDAEAIRAKLTAVLGPPTADRYGQGSQAREKVERWDWNGHSFLLAAPKGEYVAVRVIPTEMADVRGKVRLPDAKLREQLAGRVERRANGDIVLRDIPMVDQGPKGYCVPATWERAMRYMGVPADMYVLAMAGGTAAGGGTSVEGIVAGAAEMVRSGGRRIDPEGGRLTELTVGKNIRRGLPIMWAMFSMDAVNDEINKRMETRATMSDPKAWSATLAPVRKAAKKIVIDPSQAHMCMIIGYNDITGEIAVSDSWGPQFAERWMTLEEANAVSQGNLMVINF